MLFKQEEDTTQGLGGASPPARTSPIQGATLTAKAPPLTRATPPSPAAPLIPKAPAAPSASTALNRSTDPLQKEHKLFRGEYDRLTAQSTELNRQRQALVSQPGVRRSILQPRLDSFTPATEQFDGVPGVNDAVKEIDRRLQPIGEERRALIPHFQRLTEGFREQTARNEANTALSRVGAAPIPTMGSTATPAAGSPKPSFGDVRGGVRTSYGQPPQTPSTQPGSQAGGASGYFIGSNGVRKTINPDGTVAGMNPNGMVANMQSPGMPTSSLSQALAPRLTRGPAVASTFGQSVLTMPDDNQVLLRRPDVAFRGPDAMAEQYNAREDREARQKALSDLDSRRFRLELIEQHGGRKGRAATEALDSLARQQAALAAGGEQLSAAALQGRANRGNTLANTELEQAGADRRAELEAELTQQDIFLRRDAQAAGQRGVQQVLAGENGTVSLLRNDGTLSTLTNQDGSPFRQTPALTRGEITPQVRLDYIGRQIESVQEQMASNLVTPEMKALLQQQLDGLNSQADALMEHGRIATDKKTGRRKQYDATTGSWKELPNQ